MKKLQCEVCGSTELKKVDAEIFECQCCGVQYSKNELQRLLIELTGEVKIDYSKEIENLLTRASQFSESGDFSKAAEYYNKVLDLAPANETAQQAIRAIDAQSEQELKEAEKQAPAITVFKHTIDPEDGLSYFFNTLRKAPEVAPDVFCEVEIMSVTQGYFPFSVISKQYSGSYDGVACYRKKVPYTDYETKTDFHNKNQDGTYKTKQVAVTKYREETDRKNISGSFSVNHFGIFSVSQKLANCFTSLAPGAYDAAMDEDRYHDDLLDANLQKNYYNDVILHKLEEQIAKNYSVIKSDLTEVCAAQTGEIKGLEIFDGISDADWENRRDEMFLSEARTKAQEKVNSLIPGDHSENVSYRCSSSSGSTQTVYLPLQIVEYAYRGKFYLSAMFLIRGSRFVFSYPCDTSVKKTKDETDKVITTVKEKPLPIGLKVLYAIAPCFLLAFLWLAITGELTDTSDIFIGVLMGLPFLIAAIIWHIIWKSGKKAATIKAESESSAVLDQAKSTYQAAHENSAQAFFRVYHGLASVKEAAAAAKAVTNYQADVAFVKGRTVSAFMLSGKVEQEAAARKEASSVTDTAGQPLAEGSCYTVRLISPGADQTSVCKTIREACGIGLASAKEITEVPRSVVAGCLTAAAAEALTVRLQAAGAAAEIEKEM